MLLLLTAWLGATSSVSLATARDVDAVADDYLDAIQAQDWERMASFLTEASVYQDFTMEYFDREPIDLLGAEAIVDFWRSSSEESGTSEIRYDIVDRFTAGPCVVLTLRLHARVSGKYWGLSEPEVELAGDIITFLRIKDGRVTRHHDYVNYPQGTKQIEALKQQRR